MKKIILYIIFILILIILSTFVFISLTNGEYEETPNIENQKQIVQNYQQKNISYVYSDTKRNPVGMFIFRGNSDANCYYNFMPEYFNMSTFGLFTLTVGPRGKPFVERTDDRKGTYIITRIINPYNIKTSLIVDDIYEYNYETDAKNLFIYVEKTLVVVTYPIYYENNINNYPIEAFENKSIKDLTFIDIHNATSTDWKKGATPAGSCVVDFANVANQSIPFLVQLEMGCRTFKVPLHYYNDKLMLCHGNCTIPQSEMTLDKFFYYVKYYLDVYPSTVMILKIENQSGITQGKIALDFKDITLKYDLYSKCYKYDGAWPTLKKMIEDKKNLIIFTDVEFGMENHPWGLILSTKWTQKNVEELIYEDVTIYCATYNSLNGNNCNNYACYWCNENPAIYNTNSLISMNHAITPDVNFAGCAYLALQVNKYENLEYKYNTMVNYIGQRVNFIGIDFFQLPFLDTLFFQADINDLSKYDF